ncbi:MAG TPA: hypothetical protein DER23_07450 [Clostridiales bacterium]|nr:hypothetical protein [Clostridiales bacterium]
MFGVMNRMAFVKIEQFKDVYEKGKSSATGIFEDKEVRFFFSKVTVGYGYRHYFVCPVCGGYCIKLYYKDNIFRCIKCSGINAYEGIQHTTRGGYDFIMYKMERFAAKHGIKVETKDEFQKGLLQYPFDYRDYNRPYRRKREPWEKALKILQALESMRTQSIFFGKIWDAETIRSVETGKNKYLEYPLPLLLKYLYPFDGKQVDTSKLL